MKKIIFIIVITALFITACSKEGGGETSASRNVELKVLEFQTNHPIAGATVNLEKCTYYDYVFGCTSYSTVASFATNATGSYSFSSSLAPDRIKASHPKYWKSTANGMSYISLYPEAWAKVNLKKVNSYPAGYKIIVGKFDASPSGYINNMTFDIIADRIVYIRCYGLSQNMISWQILNSTGTTMPGGATSPSFYINKFDTAAVTINY